MFMNAGKDLHDLKIMLQKFIKINWTLHSLSSNTYISTVIKLRSLGNVTSFLAAL